MQRQFGISVCIALSGKAKTIWHQCLCSIEWEGKDYLAGVGVCIALWGKAYFLATVFV